MRPIDAIRSIERDITHAQWAEFFSSSRTTWRFSDPPQRLSKGSLIFFAVHGLIQGVGRFVRTSTRPHSDGFYMVTTEDNEPINDRTLEFKGYAQLRYLDRLPAQYEGRYKALCKKLHTIAAQYRAAH
jgi:hypothetical protein